MGTHFATQIRLSGVPTCGEHPSSGGAWSLDASGGRHTSQRTEGLSCFNNSVLTALLGEFGGCFLPTRAPRRAVTAKIRRLAAMFPRNNAPFIGSMWAQPLLAVDQPLLACFSWSDGNARRRTPRWSPSAREDRSLPASRQPTGHNRLGGPTPIGQSRNEWPGRLAAEPN